MHFHRVKCFQILLFNNNNLIKHSYVYIQLKDQTILFLTIQFNKRNAFAHSLNVKQFYLTLLDPSTPGLSGPDSDRNVEFLHILQSSSTGASQSDGLVQYPGHLLRAGSYLSAGVQLKYSTASVDWTHAK